MVSTPISQTPQSPQANPADTGEIDRAVASIIQEVLGLDEPPPLQTSLVEDLGIESMDTMTLVLTLEDEFDARMDEEAIASLRTVGDVIGLVRSQVEGRAAGLAGGTGSDSALE